MRACMCVRMCACVRACMYVCVCMCVCIVLFSVFVCLFVVLGKGGRCCFVLGCVFFLIDTFTRNFKTSSQLVIRTKEKTDCFGQGFLKHLIFEHNLHSPFHFRA